MTTTAYGKVALTNELHELKRAAEGTRNVTLNKVWLKVCQRINAGHIDYDDARTRIIDVARGIGLGDAEILRTMASAESGARLHPDPNIPDPNAPAPERAGFGGFGQPSRNGGADVSTSTTADGASEQPATEGEARADGTLEQLDGLYLPVTGLDALPTPSPLIDGVLDGGTLFSITGRDGVYKSFLALDWLACLSTGRPWLGHDTRPADVLYVVGEGVHGLAARVNAWRTAWHTHLDGATFHVRREPVNLFRPDQPAFLDLLARARRDRYGVIIFDTLSRNTMGANLNYPSDATIVIDALDRLRKATGGSVGFVAHTGKADTDTRGASNLEDDLDLVWHLSRDDDRPGQVRAKLAKRKDGADGLTVELAPRPVDGTGSLVLEVATGGSGGADVAAPKQAVPVLRLLAASAVGDDGMAPTPIAGALGLHGNGSVWKALIWLIDHDYVVKTGTPGRGRYKITEAGRSKIAQAEGGRFDQPK